MSPSRRDYFKGSDPPPAGVTQDHLPGPPGPPPFWRLTAARSPCGGAATIGSVSRARLPSCVCSADLTAHSGETDHPFRWQTDHLFRRKSITRSDANRSPVGAKRRGTRIMSPGSPFGSTAGFASASSLLSEPACRHCARDGRESRRRASGRRRRHATCRREAGWSRPSSGRRGGPRGPRAGRGGFPR